MNDWGFLTGTKQKETLCKDQPLLDWLNVFEKLLISNSEFPYLCRCHCKLTLAAKTGHAWADVHLCCLLLKASPRKLFWAEDAFSEQEQERELRSTQPPSDPQWYKGLPQAGMKLHKDICLFCLLKQKKSLSSLKKRVNLLNRILKGVWWDLVFCHSGFYASHRGGSWSWRRRENFFPLLNWE